MTFRYCPHPLLLTVLALGWRFAADLGPVHGAWSCLVRWDGEAPPPWPTGA